MKINVAIELFENLISNTDKKSELRIYESFIGVLKSLEIKNLDTEKLQIIEEELDRLELNTSTDSKKKYYSKKLNEFNSFLKEKFSFITENYHISIGIGIGMSMGTSLGISLGVAFGRETGMTYGMIFGMMFGMMAGIIIGTIMDTQAKENGLVLSTNE